MPLLVRSAAVCALLALLAGCGGGSGAPGSLLPASSSRVAPQRAAAPQITVSPGQLQFASATAPAQTFVASLTQGGGQLDAVTSNAQCATVNPGSARTGSTFTVTPIGPGTCSISVSDKKGATATVAITIVAPTPTPMPANTPAVVHQYAIPGSNESYGITNAGNGSVWYTEWYNGAAGAMSATGGNANYPIGGGSPYGVAQGSDGNFWITDHANNAVDVMSPSGAMLAQYSTPYTPMSIASGPDRNLWFTAEDASGATGFSEVVQITSTGAMTAFATSPAAQSAKRYASSIVAGSDGRLWFTEGDYIGAVTTTGVMTEYPVPSGRSTNFITAGPDGNLWFTEEYGGYVGRISTNGIVQEYAVPTLFADPWMIAPGKDGAVWFTEAGGTAQIGRVDTNGTVTEYPIANLSGNPAILAGSDGNLWIPSANGEMYVVSY